METRLESWIQLATRAPSGDNSQPWDFAFDSGSFKITINKGRARHFLDQDMSATWISIGCLCENLERSAAFFGFKCLLNIETDHSVTVKYHTIEPQIDSNTIDVITKRQTFRGKLNKVTLDLNSFNLEFPVLNNEGRQFTWQLVPRVSKALIWKWSWLETVLWLKTSLMTDFTKWLHGKNETYEYGISLESLQVSLMDQLSLMMFKKVPNLIKTVPSWFFHFKTYFRLKFLIESSAGLLCLSGVSHDYRDYFYAGKEIQRMWLYLTQYNIKAQPLAIQSLFLNFANSDSVKDSLSDDQIRKIEYIHTKTKVALHISQNLIFTFRYGMTEQSLPLLPRKKIVVTH